MDQIVRTSTQLGAVIRRQRHSLGLSQSELGARTVLRQATISAIENGAPGTRLQTLLDVMAAIGIEMVIRERSRAELKIEDLF